MQIFGCLEGEFPSTGLFRPQIADEVLQCADLSPGPESSRYNLDESDTEKVKVEAILENTIISHLEIGCRTS